MFPLQSEGQVLEDLTIFEQDKILDDLFADCAALEGDELVNTDISVEKRPRKASKENRDHVAKGSDEFKKIMHRNIERQRRQEMAGLYASLRSLLPPECIKGRRSTSDHMPQATNYIINVQKKIDELKRRRDKLRKFYNLRRAAIDAEDPNSNPNSTSVKANISRDGMEILISSSRKNFPLSKVHKDLLGRGLNVISCISTRVNVECSLHKIQIEDNDIPSSIDLSELEESLVNVIKY